MSDEKEETTPASTFDPFAAIHGRIDAVDKKIEQLGEFVGHLVERVEEKIARAKPALVAAAAAAEAVAPGSTVAKVAELVAAGEAWACPDHPDAPTPDNRCTTEGCDQRAPA